MPRLGRDLWRRQNERESTAACGGPPGCQLRPLDFAIVFAAVVQCSVLVTEEEGLQPDSQRSSHLHVSSPPTGATS